MGTLTGRIFRSIFLTAVAVVLFAGVLVTGLVYTVLDSQLRRELLNTAEVIEAALPTTRDEAGYLESLELRDLRITWIAADGSVLYDSVASEATEWENHLARPEVQEALRSGSGFASRHSATLDVETIYLARLLPDGTILRVAGTQKSILGHMATALVPGILILLVVAAIAAASARFTAQRILRPLSTIDFEEPLGAEAYPELSPLLTRLNDNALKDARVTVINDDAARWLEAHADVFDFVVVDFPDPSSFALGKLYSTGFYRLLARHLAPGGRMVVQSTSPYYARRSFWTIVVTLEAAGLKTAPYHALVPSFGEWGYVLAGREAPVMPTAYPEGLRFLTVAGTRDLFHFPADMARLPAKPNRLNEQGLVRLFEQEWQGVTH